ncbi:ABC transporter ATP-binding protein [Pseudonocardia oroxyli]|uniref:ABC-type quaternary amine transporter n=1 Tax=Pseudonocardia oroxyli TaxID=366584 RepID=A0A1G7STZ3_PSEOR|nr:ABC transporter ATP-binding protein [Pseudonocardia oroxyli]SDG25909.1 spermidine/putrescine transport system ATP-binding protein [Pseudonocardia oroxyli]
MTAIELSRLHRRYGEATAVKELDLVIDDGEFFSLIGPSGCGKTTTLRMIAGHEQPTSGTIRVHGRDVTRVPAHRRPVQTVFQNYALFPHLDVYRNVAFGLEEARIPKREVRAAVSDMLDIVHLGGRGSAMPGELSGGQQQRVALARALVLRPEVLVLDEPLGALDLKLRRQMQTLLRTVQREVGITFVYVTHDQEEAFSMSTRVGVMNGGELEQVGTPQAVYQQPASQFVADFAGASNMVPVVVQSLGPGAYRARVEESGLELEACGPAGLAGSAAHMVLRPESLRLVDADADGAVAAKVVDAAYRGPDSAVVVDTAELGRLSVLLHNDVELDIAPGAAVGVRLPRRGPWLVGAVTPGGGEAAADGEAAALAAELSLDTPSLR